MTTPQAKNRITSVRRAAFTLVELMVVILIIGILAGIAAPVIFRALRVAKEATIINEIQQMNAAVERFRTEHGFYPPAIGPGLEINVDDTNPTTGGRATFRRYLNRIAPNHAEGNGAVAGGLQNWWRDVGSNLDQDSSLVFWLSGLCTSKQYPLSGNATLVTAGTPLAPYNANVLLDDVTVPAATIDRNVFFEFNSAQLVNAEPPLTSDPPLPNGIKVYHQPEGAGDDLAYVYRDFKSYTVASNSAYHSGVDGMGNPINFFNPTTFQIASPGMDGTLLNLGLVADSSYPTNVLNTTDPTQDDNITNFSNGRLEKSFE